MNTTMMISHRYSGDDNDLAALDQDLYSFSKTAVES